jgi:DNA-binding SARP family transcriptional activator
MGLDVDLDDGVRQLEAAIVDLLERVGRARLESGEFRAALEAAERALSFNVLNERLWRLALEAERAVGLREAVAGRYRELCKLLDEQVAAPARPRDASSVRPTPRPERTTLSMPGDYLLIVR